MPNYLPKIDTNHAITRTATTDIVGSNAVEVTAAGAVGVAAADSAKFLGFAMHDAKTGESVTVSFDSVQRPIASGVIGVGVKVYTAASGRVSATGTNNPIGISLNSAVDGAQVDVKLTR